MKKMVLNVTITNPKHKVRLMKNIAELQGIDQISVDEEKGQLTVIGMVDPVHVVNKLRDWKTCEKVTLHTVELYKKPPEDKKKEEEEEGKQKQKQLLEAWQHQAAINRYVPYTYLVESSSCSIL